MVELLNELLLDYAESRLFSFIKRNDFRAIIYLLQTKGKNRGYSRYWKKKEEGESHSDMIINLTSLKDAEILAKMLGSWKNIRVNGVECVDKNNEHGV
jgi:predicted CopG family antitoxin